LWRRPRPKLGCGAKERRRGRRRRRRLSITIFVCTEAVFKVLPLVYLEGDARGASL
jgi:hypothetical protein